MPEPPLPPTAALLPALWEAPPPPPLPVFAAPFAPGNVPINQIMHNNLIQSNRIHHLHP